MNKTKATGKFAFRWQYILLPLIMLLASAILISAFYSRLPFPVVYHFAKDGTPDMWAIPGLFAIWALVPQALLTLGAAIVTWIFGKVAVNCLDTESAVISPQLVMSLTGNMVALPQIVILYAMLDMLVYNTSQTRLGLPLVTFAIIAMVVGGIIISYFFFKMLKQMWQFNKTA